MGSEGSNRSEPVSEKSSANNKKDSSMTAHILRANLYVLCTKIHERFHL